ncbi:MULTISPECIES: acyl-CoA dehydrogenase family protein [Limnobacter]|uniref:Acyl-CoA dehydrogenase n=2 Tax=Limnobacter TaxID=131079 RepID=A0ABQ5YR37_9BURK|nr:MULTISPECIES: acyl-CoA dehydrogenase family protein [Limnobacter]GLR27080.1 acyl-CoA dehydrogenase [Limnobacter litoralis]
MRYPNPSWMNSDLELYRSNVRRFVEEEIKPNQQKWAKQQHVDREVWLKAGELGVLLADVPDEYGGAGGDFSHMAVLFEELAYSGDRSFGVHVHAIAAHYILNHGTEEQKQYFLPKMASGEMIGAIAMSEPGAGSDLQGVRTTAVRDGNHYVVNGSKIFISNGYLADVIVVVCKTDPAAGAKGTSLLLLETRNAEGFKVGRILEKLGQKGQDTCELFFDNVRIPAANLLGAEGAGFVQLMQELPYERLMLGVGAMAIVEMAIETTLEYAKDRKAFGKAIFDFQNTRFKMAELKSQAVVARAFIDNCIEKLIAGKLDTVTASIAKLHMSELECKTIDECLQFFGGYGYMLEYPIAQMYADARVQRIYGGTSEIMKEIIARSL